MMRLMIVRNMLIVVLLLMVGHRGVVGRSYSMMCRSLLMMGGRGSVVLDRLVVSSCWCMVTFSSLGVRMGGGRSVSLLASFEGVSSVRINIIVLAVVLGVVWGHMSDHLVPVVHNVMVDGNGMRAGVFELINRSVVLHVLHLCVYHRCLVVDLAREEPFVELLWHLDISDMIGSGVGHGFKVSRFVSLRYLDVSDLGGIVAIFPALVNGDLNDTVVGLRCCINTLIMVCGGVVWFSSHKVGLPDVMGGCCRLRHVVECIVGGIGASMGCHHGGNNER